ncbi:MAG TPA: glutathione S-transferase, partial [Hellea balneolensis]|nr:glutathione S-transferase [Hellea balneolensis]
MPYQFLAAPLSLYSGKVRGYLRWKNIPYREILANRDIYEHEIVRRVGYPIIPVLLTPNDETIQDTTDIIDYLENHEPGPSVYPDGDLQKLVALIFELFGDEYLVIAAMHYRWAYNKEYAWGQFGKTL